MKIRLVSTLALIFLIFVALLATLVYVGVIETPMSRIAGNLGILRTSRVASSQLVLQQLRDVLTFHSVEYVYRTVFPHDYYPEGVNINQVLNRLAMDNRPIEEVLTPEEEAYWQAYNLAVEVGLRPGREEFIVVTVRARGGFDLEGSALDPSRPREAPPGARNPGAASEAVFAISEETDSNGNPVRRLTIWLPEPEVVDIVVEDVDPELYRYPEVGLDPEGWRQVAEFVSQEVTELTVEEGILDRTRENTESFLRSLFLQAGYDEVIFP